MIRKWIVIPLLLVSTLFGAVYTMDTWIPFLQDLKPEVELVIDKGTRKEVITTLVAQLNANYVFPEKAKQMETALLQHLRDGKYDGITDGETFAKQLTEDLRQVSRDLHMAVRSSPEPVPYDRAMPPPPASKVEWEQRTPFARRMLLNLGLAMGKIGAVKVDHLEANIGYLQLREFPPPFIMADRYPAAMDKLADTDGLIVDLRDNRGGSPATVALLVSYFVDQRTRVNDLWDRTSGVTTQQWTSEKLEGKLYGGKKPVVILVGPDTKSAGEDFAYTMQAMKRATLIGAPTWGGAHPSRPFRLSEYFMAWIPSARSISPITHTNWEGVGVQPDIPATQDKALAMAQELLQRRLAAR
ncbi:S41 family peptidase [Massilia yuzhufengensis]|uniref:N-terminal domain of Peptidase_S41 n=1 Tax=Massilia yuzhufengensis TaxID=1164594 RepID=A0A1I1NEH2_9BURK|nr:S41 family peptidase [Massilia yuzhufengensis]SFC95652.1 N-terminal domain of Peptidase_S41 [Massilia yuzhufengensis]